MPYFVYKSIEKSFKLLWGWPHNVVPDTEIDGVPILKERNFIQNIRFVNGVDCPFFGKMLYLYFANGFDRAKITMHRFFEGLKPYTQDEEKWKHSNTTFKILDIDRDGLLNVINLVHIFKNLPSNSRLGQEIFLTISEFLDKNLHNKLQLQKIVINREYYLKICNQNPCLTQEIRTFFLGIPGKMRI